MTDHLPAHAKPPEPTSWLPGKAEQQGAISIAAGAALWGLFWIPLRFLNDHGVTGLWAVALVMSAVIVPSAIALVSANKLHTLRSGNAWFIGFAMGLSSVLYFTGVIVSDVIRVVFLFYLLPVWTTLAARLLYKEAITPMRLMVIGIALLGLWLLLGAEGGIPIPSNVGDWCGLFAGFCWGVSLALIRGKENANAGAIVCTTAITASFIALAAATLLLSTEHVELAALPSVDAPLLVLVATLAFSIFLLYPSLMGQIWGAQRVAAPTAALLTMTEILVATASAYYLVGTELTSVSFIGATIILVAVLFDIALKYRQAD